MRDNYQSSINAFPQALELFIERTQKYRNTIPGFSVDCNIIKSFNKNFEVARYAKKLIKNGFPGWVLAFTKLAAYSKKHGIIRTLGIIFSVASKLL